MSCVDDSRGSAIVLVELVLADAVAVAPACLLTSGGLHDLP
jgi:hypothetical protein